MANSIELTIRASQIKQGITTEHADQVILKTKVIAEQPTESKES